MSEKQYYFCVVKVNFEDAKGTIKSRKEKYLVEGVDVTDVEKKIMAHLETLDGEIVQVSAANIIDVVK